MKRLTPARVIIFLLMFLSPAVIELVPLFITGSEDAAIAVQVIWVYIIPWIIDFALLHLLFKMRKDVWVIIVALLFVTAYPIESYLSPYPNDTFRALLAFLYPVCVAKTLYTLELLIYHKFARRHQEPR
ncbi:MAG: hypothetical protein LBS19_12395 [Clostridiales bacterium]|jgi:hypothetical protein|nr:hypothetical protein [Clostridiales bacterium]